MSNSPPTKYTPDTPLDERVENALSMAADDVAGALTIDKYETWRQRVAGEYPSTSQIKTHIGGTWRDICRDRDIPTAGYTAEQIIEAIRSAARDGGIPISRGEYDRWRHEQSDTYPASETIYRQMGWLEACGEAGVPSHQTQIAKKEIITAIQQAAEANGEPLTVRRYKQWREGTDESPPSVATISERLGWAEGCEQAGVEHGEAHPKYTKEDAADALTSAFDTIGEALSTRKYEQWRTESAEEAPCESYITDVLGDGSWIVACDSVGIPTPTTAD